MRLTKLYIVAFIVIGFGCQKNKVHISNINKADSIEKLKETALKSGARNDTLFLDYRFGMSKAQFNKHSLNLLETGRVYADQSDNFSYDITPQAANYSYQLHWAPEYYRGALYKLNISAKPKNAIYNSFSKSGLEAMQVASIIMQRYGIYDYKIDNYFGKQPLYGWMKGNLKIEVMTGIDDARIFYTDMVVKAEKDSIAKKQADQSREAF